MSETFDTLKKPESDLIDFSTFTDEQVDAVIIYIAKIARETRTEYGLSKEQRDARVSKFFAIMDSWPEDFRQRVTKRILDNAEFTKQFWAKPADAIILATKAIELA